jgi:hypothetical protein
VRRFQSVATTRAVAVWERVRPFLLATGPKTITRNAGESTVPATSSDRLGRAFSGSSRRSSASVTAARGRGRRPGRVSEGGSRAL